MYLIKMRPGELKKATTDNIPVIISAGSVEYHGPHLPIGTDFLIADSVITEVEKRIPDRCIIAPSLPFSSTMNWAGDATEGDADFSPDALYVYAREVFAQLTAMGFKRIYVLQHHQGPEGLPCLSLRRAAAEIVRDITKGWGHSWGRLPHEKCPNPKIFELIRIASADSFSEYAGQIPFGHAGKGETQFIMAAYPETVDMDELAAMKTELKENLPRWLSDADSATYEEGKKWLEACVSGWINELLKS